MIIVDPDEGGEDNGHNDGSAQFQQFKPSGEHYAENSYAACRSDGELGDEEFVPSEVQLQSTQSEKVR